MKFIDSAKLSYKKDGPRVAKAGEQGLVTLRPAQTWPRTSKFSETTNRSHYT